MCVTMKKKEYKVQPAETECSRSWARAPSGQIRYYKIDI
jgi:hypothetical protein